MAFSCGATGKTSVSRWSQQLTVLQLHNRPEQGQQGLGRHFRELIPVVEDALGRIVEGVEVHILLFDAFFFGVFLVGKKKLTSLKEVNIKFICVLCFFLPSIAGLPFIH